MVCDIYFKIRKRYNNIKPEARGGYDFSQSYQSAACLSGKGRFSHQNEIEKAYYAIYI